MEFASPSTALILLALALVAAIVGVRLLVQSWAHESSVAQRSALEDAERRASRLRSRLDRRVRRSAVGRDLATRLAAAGVEVRTIDFVLIAAGVALLVYVLADTILPGWMAVVAAAGGVRACWGWVEHKRAKRREAFVAQLPDIARILSNASSAGLAVRTAIEMAAEELDDPAGSEMAIVAEELRLGQSLEAALANLEKRMPSRDVGVLISTLVIQQRSGGDLVRALQEIAHTLEGRRDLHRELRTLMAGSVFTGYLVGAMGIGAVLLLNLISPDVIERMTSQFLGQIALIVAAALYVAGYVLVRRVTRIEI